MEKLGKMTQAGKKVLPDMSEKGFNIDIDIFDVQLRTSEHRSMYSYVRLSIDRCTLRTSEHRSMYATYV